MDDFKDAFKNVNPNDFIDRLQKMTSDFTKQVEGLKNVADILKPHTVKNKYPIKVNGKIGEVWANENGFISIKLEEINNEDVKEIVKRLLKND